MSNETDLDWLARNVHVWREGANYVCVNHTDGGYVFHEHNRNCAILFTKNQWLSRRAELQNKPSWKSISSSINYLSQCADGQWIGHHQMPEEGCECFECDCEIAYYGYGEVLGRWRDTLEKRTEEFKPSIEEANRLAQEFKLFTSIEGNQEHEMKQDNGWFERGDLPPVGVECDIRHSCWNSEKYEKVTVAAITNEYVIVKYATFEQHYMLKDISFRPIRTEREELEILLRSTALSSFDDLDIIAGAIIAAGFRKEKK